MATSGVRYAGFLMLTSIGNKQINLPETKGEDLAKGGNVTKMVIVEGPDNSGKTKLVEMFGNVYKSIYGQLPYIEHSPSKLFLEGRYRDWLQWIEDSLNRDEHAIYDRHPIISEAVYGPTLRDSNVLSTTTYLERLKAAKPLIVYCKPPVKEVLSTTKPEMKGVKDRLSDLIAAYEVVITELRLSGFNVFTYDWTNRVSVQSASVRLRNFFAMN